MIVMFADIHHTTSYQLQHRKAQLVPLYPPKQPIVLPLGCEDLDAIVSSVSHIHLPSHAVLSQATPHGEPDKLSLAIALLPKGAYTGKRKGWGSELEHDGSHCPPHTLCC